jgi:hypothetical protein
LLGFRKSSSGCIESIITINMLRPRIVRALPSLRRSIHRLPPLEQFQNGIPGLLTPDGFRIAWTEYQGMMLEKLNALTVGTYTRLLIASEWSPNAS